MKKLDKKVIIITGGTKGIGKAFAIAASKEGAIVVVAGRDEKSAQSIVETIKKNGSDGMFIYTDLQNIDDCKNLFDKTFNTFNRIDGFFNYAGITSIGSLESCDEKTFDDITSVNYKAAFFCCQNAIKYMIKSGGGSIVLAGSAHAWSGEKDRAAYAISKGALRVLNEHIAHQYADKMIRSNYLTIGWTPTDGEISLRKSLGENETELLDRASKIIPMGRMCQYDDYIDALIYLMSDNSKMMTGSILRITGGEYI